MMGHLAAAAYLLLASAARSRRKRHRKQEAHQYLPVSYLISFSRCLLIIYCVLGRRDAAEKAQRIGVVFRKEDCGREVL